MDRMLMITNSGAGSAAAGTVHAAAEVLRSAGEVEIVTTKEIADLERVLAERDGRIVVVVGGDGSLHAVMAVLHDKGWLTDTAVALIPLGTGNDFARGMGIPLDAAEAAHTMLSVEPRCLDLVLDDEGGVVVNAVHVGVGVHAAEQAQELKPRFGRFGYLLGALQTGLSSRGERLRVVVDDDVVSDGRARVLQVAVGNGRFVGGGVPLMPEAVADDGRIDVVVSFALSTPRRLLYAVRLRLGQHTDNHDVEQRRGRQVVVESKAGFRWNADGELKGPARRRTWRVQPNVWTMYAPPADTTTAEAAT